MRQRLLFIVPRYGTIYRGVEAFVRELVRRLDRDAFDCTVLSGPHGETSTDVHFEIGELILRERLAWFDRLPGARRLFAPFGLASSADVEAWSLVRQFRRRWKDDEFDIVIPLGGSSTYRYARQAFPLAKIISIGQAGPVRADLILSDLFVALTPHDETRAREMCADIPTVVIPNGVDVERFVPPAAATSSERVGKTVLCVAALVPDKRHDLLFDAAMALPGHVRIRCVGTGPAQGQLERHPLARAGRVEFLQCTFDEMPHVYQTADVFTLASPVEAFGIVFIEAMAAGLPVVAHDGPRQRFVIGADGSLCNVFDAGAYAHALTNALEAGSATRANARKQAAKFDWSIVANQYAALMSGAGRA